MGRIEIAVMKEGLIAAKNYVIPVKAENDVILCGMTRVPFVVEFMRFNVMYHNKTPEIRAPTYLL